MIEVLDCGYINLIETWGGDERIIEAARMSTNKGFQGWDRYGRCSACGVDLSYWIKDGLGNPVHGDNDPSGEYCLGEIIDIREEEK